MNTVGVTHTRRDADEDQEAGVPRELVVAIAPPVVPPSSVAPPARVLIQPERAPGPPQVRTRRFAFLDGLRALCAHAIVWHHITFYGPLSDIAYPLMPTIIDIVADYSRLVVQVFLVMGGFVTAQGLLRGVPTTARELGGQIAKRYWRLAWPYLVVVGVAIVANTVASWFMTHESIAAPPTAMQVLAHAFFLQTLLGYESLSSGFWYIAIDFQLSLLTLIVCACMGELARRCGRPGRMPAWSMVILFPCAALALFWWNRDPMQEIWAGYYFGSYFLGIATAWCLAGRISWAWFAAGVCVVIAALAYDYRVRPAIALSTAIIIAIAGLTGGLERWLRGPTWAYWGRLSYSLFLIHFPVCLVINAVLSTVVADRPILAVGGMIVAWLASCLAAVVFHHYIEDGAGWQRIGVTRSPWLTSSPGTIKPPGRS